MENTPTFLYGGTLETTQTDNVNEVNLIYTKLKFDRLLEIIEDKLKKFKLSREGNQTQIDNVKQSIKKYEDKGYTLDSLKERSNGNMMKGMILGYHWNLSNYEKDINYQDELIPKIEKLISIIKNDYYFLDETKKDSPRSKIVLKINKFFLKEMDTFESKYYSRNV